MGIELRAAHIEDCRLLAEIHCESWQTAYRGIVPDTVLQKMDAHTMEEKFRSSIENGSESIVLAQQDNEACGYIIYGPCRDDDLKEQTGEIWGIYLLPSSWGSGTGRLLLEHGLAGLKRSGCRLASLWVMEDNHRARRFYEKMGFVHDGAVKTLPLGAVIRALRYIRQLA